MTTWLAPTTKTFIDEADLFFRDLFSTNGFFQDIWTKPAISYPLDVKESNEGLEFTIAACGLDKKDINIEIKDGDTLIISHKKDNTIKNDDGFIYRGITNKSFNFAWKLSNKFDISKIDANLDKGLLKIKIPISPEKETKKIEVK